MGCDFRINRYQTKSRKCLLCEPFDGFNNISITW